VSTNTAGVGSSWSVLGLFETFKRVLDGAFSRLPYLGEMVLRLKRNPLGQVYFPTRRRSMYQNTLLQKHRKVHENYPRVSGIREPLSRFDKSTEVVLGACVSKHSCMDFPASHQTTTSSFNTTHNGILHTNTTSPMAQTKHTQTHQHKMAVLPRPPTARNASPKDPTHLR
jgi:hypothetical protein